MATKTYTDEEYKVMEAALAERNQKLADETARLETEMKAREDAALEALRTWLAQDHVQRVRSELLALIPGIQGQPRVSVYAYDFLGSLTNAAGSLPISYTTPPAFPSEGTDNG